jgi:hypothetical protein
MLLSSVVYYFLPSATRYLLSGEIIKINHCLNSSISLINSIAFVTEYPVDFIMI